MFKVEFERNDNVLVVVPSGRLDGMTAKEFESKASANINVDDERLVVDLGNVDYISSAGLRALLTKAKEAQGSNCKFVVCCLSEANRAVFRISGFDQIMSVFDTREEALAA